MKKLIVIILVITTAFASSATAQNSVTKMQSLYIYNFIKNIKWSNVNDSYVIGVYAKDATVSEINGVLGSRELNGKSIQVKKIAFATQASSCHVVYVSSDNAKSIKSMGNLKNVLIVSEKGQINNGASIAFIIENSKLKFKINEAACKKAGLQVSKKLISLGV